MWRDFFKNAFQAKEEIYSGDLLNDINERLDSNRSAFLPFHIDELNEAINLIETNKSYKMYCHWKY